MTKLDALKAALRAAVRDGDREVARALTRIVFQEISTGGRCHMTSSPGLDFYRKSVRSADKFHPPGLPETADAGG